MLLPVVGVGACCSSRWRHGILERFGLWRKWMPGAVWIHGASVGEIRSGLGLIGELERCGVRCFATTSTTTGRDLARNENPAIPCHLIPFDHPWLLSVVFRRARPKALVFLEKDLWPCHVKMATDFGVPVFLLSARMSEQSAKRYGRAGFFFRRVLARLSAVGARSDQDAERFIRLGASQEKVFVTGDLKLQKTKGIAECTPDLHKALLGQKVWVAASTHREEERVVATIQLRLKKELGSEAPLLVIAPRHPERFEDAFTESSLQGLSVVRRSDMSGAILTPGDILFLDSIGELRGIYSVCNLAFIGGSLVDRGGHNPLEAIQLGLKVLIGPHLRNVEHLVEEFKEGRELEVVANEVELEATVVAFFMDRDAAGLVLTNNEKFHERFNVASKNAKWLVDWMHQ